MKKRIVSLVLVFVLGFAAQVRADEGMWLLYLLGDKVYKEMVKKGLKLTKDQLYSLNSPSIKDAIVIFGGGCTGEIVSGQGLVFTNHHCGYDAIAKASTLEHNYLQNGFWAKSKGEEIASQLSVQFLVRIDDVTAEVEAATKGLTGAQLTAQLNSVAQSIAKKATEGTGYEGRVMPLFKRNQFLLFQYQTFNDVRLVGAPAESVGKFGGDTDNWEWPRHTGDFSVFRVYMSPDGKPAPYSAENIPLKPKHFLPVSIKGYKDGDFAMIFGYPGGTERYETSYGVKLKTDIENNAIVNLRDMRLKYMFEEMKKDPAIRLQLSPEYAGIANYWKFFDGETKQLLKYDIYGRKKVTEGKFNEWAKGKPEYENVFASYDKIYQDWTPYARHRIYMNEGVFGSPLIAFAARLEALKEITRKKGAIPEEIAKSAEAATNARKDFFKYENKVSDQKILAAVTKMFYTDIDASQHPKGFFEDLRAHYGDLNSSSTYDHFASDVFSKTIVFDDAKWNAFVAKPDSITLRNDPACRYVESFLTNYNSVMAPRRRAFLAENNDLAKKYMQWYLQTNKPGDIYPDANFTMRLSYGNVKSYKPRDAVFYDYVCTLSGVVDKYKPGDYEFDLPANLIEAYKKKDFGQYKDPVRNDIVVSFITTNDITGGNSGSPVINAKGELIGLAFDGNYEALSHKLAFDKDLNRTICVDVRYVLWCIDKLGGAQNIISELTLR